MLEFDDIQHILLMRVPALTGRYEFLSFRNTTGGRTWLSAIREKVQSAAEVRASAEREKRWVTVAFTWNGLRALGVDEASLATFPEEFRQGMVARAEMLGDTGANHPDNWVGGLASPSLHAIVILFAGDEAERERCVTEHNKFIAQCSDVDVLSSLDLAAVPLGSHARGMNPRDTAANMNRRRMIRRGATYGPHLPEDAPEDGVERGIAAFVICASLIRQFEFAQNVWANDRNFHELGNERDPIIGAQDGTLEYKIPKRPIRKKITGLPAFTTVRGGAYFFLPGIKALRYLATLDEVH